MSRLFAGVAVGLLAATAPVAHTRAEGEQKEAEEQVGGKPGAGHFVYIGTEVEVAADFFDCQEETKRHLGRRLCTVLTRATTAALLLRVAPAKPVSMFYRTRDDPQLKELVLSKRDKKALRRFLHRFSGLSPTVKDIVVPAMCRPGECIEVLCAPEKCFGLFRPLPKKRLVRFSIRGGVELQWWDVDAAEQGTIGPHLGVDVHIGSFAVGIGSGYGRGTEAGTLHSANVLAVFAVEPRLTKSTTLLVGLESGARFAQGSDGNGDDISVTDYTIGAIVSARWFNGPFAVFASMSIEAAIRLKGGSGVDFLPVGRVGVAYDFWSNSHD